MNGLDEATVDAWMAALSSHEPAAGPSVADVLATDFEAAGIDAPPPVIEPISPDDGPIDFNDGFEEPDDDGTWSSIGA